MIKHKVLLLSAGKSGEQKVSPQWSLSTTELERRRDAAYYRRTNEYHSLVPAYVHEAGLLELGAKRVDTHIPACMQDHRHVAIYLQRTTATPQRPGKWTNLFLIS